MNVDMNVDIRNYDEQIEVGHVIGAWAKYA